ncbi:hypothetical protein [Zavarzinia sp.]|uniref:hypothetical protein n=1 Tax=Zavarzinia sp. TaxID=2027920 RepID=UPI00356A532C
MLFHASIPAQDAETAAAVLAEIWHGEALPFPPVPGAYVVFAGDERATTLEIYPAERTLEPSAEGVAVGLGDPRMGYVGDHVAIASARPASEIAAIARAAGWRVQVASRGGLFDVVEVWLENRYMIEVLSPEMQAAYCGLMTAANWRGLLAAGPGPQASGGVAAG